MDHRSRLACSKESSETEPLNWTALEPPSTNAPAAEYYELPELPKVIFYAMLLNEAERLGRSGRKCRESGQCPCSLGKHGVPSYLQYERNGQLREGDLHLALEERFTASSPFPEDFHVLCPRFSLVEAEGTAAEFEIPEIVQATFYAMLLSEAVELGVAHEYTAENMKSSLVGLRWSTFEVWMDCMDCPLKAV
ncbi:hypothetical protein Cgig2_011357 [Carnegiea gigantea]|uniref:Uncharacterized protein n=1 Tax=Carnegiea gigantea TaxID=171969 RepID=A0A9Q1KQ38_9CARY|nr:hypothetical protein Cgig2_011357 [Carnegiea gigantea]